MVAIIGKLGKMELITPGHDGLVVTRIVPAELLNNRQLVRNVIVKALVETMAPLEMGNDDSCHTIGILQ